MLNNQKFVSELDEVKGQWIGLVSRQNENKVKSESGEFQTIVLEAIGKDHRMQMQSNVPEEGKRNEID